MVDSIRRIDDFPDDLAAIIWSRTKFAGLRMLRSALLAVAAIVLSLLQLHHDYSEWQIGLLVLCLGALNRFHWLAGASVAWLLFLYLFTPEIAEKVASVIAPITR